MIMKKLLSFLFLISVFTSSAQELVRLSIFSEVSIITAGAGDNLYEAFGHSAIRIKDPVLQLDLIYNYGMFDFNTPNFYTNFTKGKLYYKLGRYPFKYFIESYKKDERWLKEQVLYLNQEEKQKFFSYLENNAAPENAKYLYDPFFNNCASKLRDITTTILAEKINFNTASIDKNLTLRTLMNRRIHWNSWGNFGINLALGNKLDKKVAPEAYMYLPDYVYAIFKTATVGDKALVKKENLLLTYKNKNPKAEFFGPFTLFTLLFLVVMFITYKDYKYKKRNKSVDFWLLFTSGIIGVLLVFLWFFTDHSTTQNNFNILWAFLPNLFVAFLSFKEKYNRFLMKYIFLLVALILILMIMWISGFQIFPLALIPILMVLLVRYAYYILFLNQKINKT